MLSDVLYKNISNSIFTASQYLKCKPGWFLRGRSCYRLGPLMNWTDARANCTRDGGDLTTIADEYENSQLSQ